MKDAIRMNVLGIKCDNPSCEFVDMSVEFEDYKDWLNKPCPKCGSNLLTDRDYLVVKSLFKVTNALNKIWGQREDDEEDVCVSVEMNGTDKVKFVQKEEENE